MKGEQTIRYRVVIDAPEEISELVSAYDDYIDKLAYQLHENEVVYGCTNRNDEVTSLALDRIQRAKDAILPSVGAEKVGETHGFPKEIAGAYLNGQKWALPKMLWYSFLYGSSRLYSDGFNEWLGYLMVIALLVSGYVLGYESIYFIAVLLYFAIHASFHASSVFHKKYSEPKKSLY